MTRKKPRRSGADAATTWRAIDAENPALMAEAGLAGSLRFDQRVFDALTLHAPPDETPAMRLLTTLMALKAAIDEQTNPDQRAIAFSVTLLRWSPRGRWSGAAPGEHAHAAVIQLMATIDEDDRRVSVTAP